MLVEALIMSLFTNLTHKALNFFMKTLKARGFFQFEIIINVLVGSFRLI